MKWQQLISDIFVRISHVLEKALEGLTLDDLNHQFRPDCNSIGWLTWHLTREQDRAIATFTGEEQLWVKYSWHTKFNRPPNPEDTGFGHSLEDLAEFKSPNVQTLIGYYHDVLEQSKHYFSTLSAADLNKELSDSVLPAVGVGLAGVISDNLQHAGQVAYLRGLLKGKGWLDE